MYHRQNRLESSVLPILTENTHKNISLNNWYKDQDFKNNSNHERPTHLSITFDLVLLA
jgi:hypothetical protein